MSAPKPMPMAIMRNAHEVIRGAMKDIQSLLDQSELKEASKLWQDLHRFNALHMHMEEGKVNVAKGLFQMMDDHANNAATKAGVRGQHTELEKLEEQVQENLVKTPNLEEAKKVFATFIADNEAHLVKEENILMPCVQQMVKGGHPVKKYILTYLLPVVLIDNDDMEFFVKFANQVLERHDNGPRVRVFDQALWAVSTPAQWNQWKVWIEETLTADKYEAVMRQIQAFVEEQKAMKNAQELPKEPKWLRLMKNPVEC